MKNLNAKNLISLLLLLQYNCLNISRCFTLDASFGDKCMEAEQFPFHFIFLHCCIKYLRLHATRIISDKNHNSKRYIYENCIILGIVRYLFHLNYYYTIIIAVKENEEDLLMAMDFDLLTKTTRYDRMKKMLKNSQSTHCKRSSKVRFSHACDLLER